MFILESQIKEIKFDENSHRWVIDAWNGQRVEFELDNVNVVLDKDLFLRMQVNGVVNPLFISRCLTRFYKRIYYKSMKEFPEIRFISKTGVSVSHHEIATKAEYDTLDFLRKKYG